MLSGLDFVGFYIIMVFKEGYVIYLVVYFDVENVMIFF